MSGIPMETVEDSLQAWVATGTGVDPTKVIWLRQNGSRPVTAFATLCITAIRRVGQDWVVYRDNPLVLAPITVTGATGDTFVAPAHGLALGDGPITVDTAAYGLALGTNYWAIPVDANHLQVASTFLNARASTPVTLSAGAATVHFNSTGDTRRAGAELKALAQGARKLTVTVQVFGGGAEGSGSPEALLDTVVAILPIQASSLRAAGVGILDIGPIRSTSGVIDAAILEPRAIMDVTVSLASEVQLTDTYIERVLVTPTIDGVDKPVITLT